MITPGYAAAAVQLFEAFLGRMPLSRPDDQPGGERVLLPQTVGTGGGG